MGLIARQLEAAGIPTLCFSSAYSITAAVKPPRAVFLDFPLGHTTGKPHDVSLQRRIMVDALKAFESIQVPGEIRTLGYHWASSDDWKDRVMRPRSGNSDRPESKHADDRVERVDVPQYQFEEDAEACEPGCPTCVFTHVEY